MSILDQLSSKLGLPPLHEVNELLSGESGKRLSQLLTRLERLSKNDSQLKDAVELLRLVKQLDESGALGRLIEVLREIGPLVKGKNAQALLSQLSGLQGMLDKLMSG